MSKILIAILEIASKLASIAVPIVLFFLGQQYTREKDASDRKQKQINRVSTLIPLLASNDDLTRQMAIAEASGLQEQRELPPELYRPLAELVALYPQSNGAHNAAKILAAAENDPAARKAIQASQSLVYLQIRAESQRPEANKVRLMLAQNDYSAPGVEWVSHGPDEDQIRYFNKQDGQGANDLAQLLKDKMILTLSVRKVDLAPTHKVPIRQFEIWFALPSKR